MKSGFKQNCFYCSEVFEPSAKWQIFCKDECKTKFNRNNSDICFYCGDLATDRDHILPVSSRGPKRSYKNQELVKSCKECNVILGANLFKNIFDRFDYLIKTYNKRYKLNKPLPRWSDEELSLMGKNMRSSILKDRKIRETGENKVIFLNNRKYELFVETDEYEENIDQNDLINKTQQSS